MGNICCAKKLDLDDDEKKALLGGKEKDSAWLRISMGLFGPGLFCCLADTDASCLITAGQSGATWGYMLLLPQFVLIPILFAAQELTIRLAVYTGKGHTACIRDHFGSGWAWFATFFLVIECIGAMIGEMSGVAVSAELWGLSRMSGAIISVIVVTSVVLGCSYKSVEKIGITLGLFELSFVLSMFLLHPDPYEVVAGPRGALTFSSDPDYLMLLSSNIGAVIMPWMIYFQQNAVIARRLSAKDLPEERGETLVGSILTQLVMIGTLVTMAAAPNVMGDLTGAREFVDGIAPVVGLLPAKILVTCAFVGGSLCAAFVVAITPAWAVLEACGLDNSYSLDQSPTEAPIFYGAFMGVVAVGFGVLSYGIDIIKLNIYIMLMDALLLPFALGFLYLLACSEVLPESARLTGSYKYLLGIVFGLVTVIGMGCGFYGLYHDLGIGASLGLNIHSAPQAPMRALRSLATQASDCTLAAVAH
jgi:Mn2+/Fe2+ NRAMP family transporter